MANVAVVGSGIAGLTVANFLSANHDVTVYEKSNGYGGRLATRYYDEFEFDPGVQFFTAQTEAFRQFIQPMLEQNVIQRWDAQFVEFTGSKITGRRDWQTIHPHYVGVPRMNAVGKFLAKDLNVSLNTQIDSIEKTNEGHWQLVDSEQVVVSEVDWVIVTAPAQQSLQLLPKDFPNRQVISDIKMLGCFALMLGFEQPFPNEWDAALVRDADISWISANHTKPGRKVAFCLLAQANNSWAEAHMEEPLENIQQHLMSEVERVTQLPVNEAVIQKVHRWRYANVGKQNGYDYHLDTDLKIAACGDWCIHGRVESAFLSAYGLAHELLKLV